MKKRSLVIARHLLPGIVAAVCALVSAAQTHAAGVPGSKDELTPAFWQRDPDADFEDAGRMHCAPTSVADGLIYLAKANGMTDLVAGVDHDAQIELIKELADDFGTDPSNGGTNPDKILTGLQRYARGRGFELSRLELKTWRWVSAANKEYKTATKPDAGWMREAARNRNAVMLFNFGWYREDEERYTRKGGHWVAVVGAGAENQFYVHNPLLQPDRQTQQTLLTLGLLQDDLIAAVDKGEVNLKGYYEGNGPGLPHGKKFKAILDAVLVFSMAKQ